jgi:hypothetical protein
VLFSHSLVSLLLLQSSGAGTGENDRLHLISEAEDVDDRGAEDSL